MSAVRVKADALTSSNQRELEVRMRHGMMLWKVMYDEDLLL